MPTGLKNSPDGSGGSSLPSLVSSQPRKAINHTLRLVLAVSGLPQRFPGLIVPEGLSVSLRGHNGTATGNAAPVYIGAHQEYANPAYGRIVTPDTEINYPVDHTGQIWVYGTAGDGVVATISGVPIG